MWIIVGKRKLSFHEKEAVAMSLQKGQNNMAIDEL